MYEFLVDQTFGINGLVNLSNIIFLAANSARDVVPQRHPAVPPFGGSTQYPEHRNLCGIVPAFDR
jgi:hypothetical protein